nr:hypothetical protein [Paraburkholderia sp. ZP32-5]
MEGEVVGGADGDDDGELSFPPPQALNRRAVAALRANASVVFFGESISSPDSDLLTAGLCFLRSVIYRFISFGLIETSEALSSFSSLDFHVNISRLMT